MLVLVKVRGLPLFLLVCRMVVLMTMTMMTMMTGFD
jgi:hypothetical protein